MSTNAKISIHVNQQLPQHVRSEYETFVSFLEAYYEYLEQSNNTVAYGKTTERTRNLLNYRDVDKTLTDFSERLYEHFLALIPKNALADKDVIIKNVQDFYRARGTEKALKFLLRILIGEEATIYYPKRDILRWSDGKWYIQKSLRVTSTAIDGVSNSSYSGLQAFRSTRITGNTSNATAVVEKVDRFLEGGTQIDELILSGIRGTFSDGETIRANFNESTTTRFITSNVFAGILNTLTIDNPGLSYNVGDYVIFSGGGGANGNAVVTSVTTGNITSLTVVVGGAGFRANDFLLFSGGGGGGANAKVAYANTDESIHPNTYNIGTLLWRDIAGTLMNSANYPNMMYGIVNSPNTATRMCDALPFYQLANVGPIINVVVLSSGTGYVETPTVAALANTRLQELGILGKMTIVAGGTGYNRGDVIEFFNIPGGSGTGAKGNVTANAANGAITQVKFTANGGNVPIGGWGYSSSYKPRVNVRSSTGTGANIVIATLLGGGDSYLMGSGTLGAILSIDIINRGDGYRTEPNASLRLAGDGNAQVSVSIVRGAFTYPGRYLNDDGQLSSYNFLQNRDYYQNYSYVVRMPESLANYRKAVLDILHPAGMKMFGEYTWQSADAALNLTPYLVTSNSGVLRTFITPEGTANNANGAFSDYFKLVANTGNGTNGALVLALTGEFNNNFINITNVIINNTIPLTLIAHANVSDGFNNMAQLWAARKYFANSNCFINVQISNATRGNGNVAITMYRVKTANVLNTFTSNGKSIAGAGSAALHLNGIIIRGNGAGLFVSNYNDETKTTTWTNATKVDDYQVGTTGAGALRHSTGYSYNISSASANSNVVSTPSGTVARIVLAGATWMVDG
jgi:hypothetical protein